MRKLLFIAVFFLLPQSHAQELSQASKDKLALISHSIATGGPWTVINGKTLFRTRVVGTMSAPLEGKNNVLVTDCKYVESPETDIPAKPLAFKLTSCSAIETNQYSCEGIAKCTGQTPSGLSTFYLYTRCLTKFAGRCPEAEECISGSYFDSMQSVEVDGRQHVYQKGKPTETSQ